MVTDAHLASCAADVQGKFHEFMAAFWDQGFNAYRKTRDATKLGEENVMAIAKTLGLNVAKLKTDMRGTQCAARLAKDAALLERFRVNATPSFFVNGKSRGYAGPQAFNKLIEEELAAAEKSGIPAGEYYEKVVMAGEKVFKARGTAKN